MKRALAYLLITLGVACILAAIFLPLIGCTAPQRAAVSSSLSAWWRQPPPPESPAPPAPGEAPNLPPVNPPVATDAGDAIDLATVIFDEPASPASWPITATLGAVTITADGLRAESLTGTEGWRRREDGGTKPTAGNWLLIRRCLDGRLHGAAIEWYGPGKRQVTGKRWDGSDAIHGCVGSDPAPAPGETVYVLVSGCVRAGADCGRERSNAVEARWP